MVMFKAAEQSLLIKQNTNLPSPQYSVADVFFCPALKSNLFAIAVNLKGAKRISSCPAGLPAPLLLLSHGFNIWVFIKIRACTVSPFTICVATQVFNQF